MEKFWKYNIENWDIKPPERCYNNLKKTIYYYRLNQDLNTLQQSLIKQQPFIFGCSLYEKYILSKLNGGIILMPNNKDKVRDYVFIYVCRL